MARLLFLSEARDDLRGIGRYLVATASTDVAENVLRQIQAASLRYSMQPLLGEQCFDLGADVRCFTVGSIVVYYTPISDGIRVIQVIHGARDIAVHFRKYPPR